MRTRPLRRAVAGSLLAAVLVPVACLSRADAATVTVGVTDRWYFYDEPAVMYHAAAGERNDVRVAGVGDRRVRVSDPGAVITATGRCVNEDAHTAVCRGYLLAASVRLGDLDDRLRIPNGFNATVTVAYGGAGDDTLTGGLEPVAFRGGAGDDQLTTLGGLGDLSGGPGEDRLTGRGGFSVDHMNGGPDDDVLHGGPGDDTLNGGGGRDQLFGGDGGDDITDGDRDGAPGDLGPGPDLIDGGGGGDPVYDGDAVSYAQRTRPVRVRIGSDTNAGEAGEHDTVRHITDAGGGAGDDVLIGDDRTNHLDGEAGDDVLTGRGSRDVLFGVGGRDRLSGGRGGDSLDGGRGLDALICGPGHDLLGSHRLGIAEPVPAGCETLAFEYGHAGEVLLTRVHPAGRRGSWTPRLLLYCPFVYDDANIGCHGTLTVRDRARNRLLARGTFNHDASFSRVRVPVALTALGWRWRHGQLHTAAVVRVHMRADRTPRRPFTWTLPARGRG